MKKTKLSKEQFEKALGLARKVFLEENPNLSHFVGAFRYEDLKKFLPENYLDEHGILEERKKEYIK